MRGGNNHLRGRRLGCLRAGVAAAAIGVLVAVPALPAGASLEGPCEGTATIDGIAYDASFDTADNPIVVPEDRAGLRIPYSGSVGDQNTNHSGSVGVVIGPITVTVASWGGENPDDIRATGPDSVYVLGSELNGIVGLYELTASHVADGVNCSARAMVKLEGSVLSSPIGAGSTAGAVLTGAGMLAAGIKRRKR